MSKPRLIKPSDILFTVAIVASGILIWFFALPSSQGKTAVFRQNGEVIAELPLNRDTQFSIEGNYTNLFVIENGAVFVEYTTCPNHQCQKTGSISASGFSIVCAPNFASVTITGGQEDVDAFTG